MEDVQNPGGLKENSGKCGKRLALPLTGIELFQLGQQGSHGWRYEKILGGLVLSGILFCTLTITGISKMLLLMK